ncbi:hypothetical protein QBC41DRAFT_339660 [Cercophora samala]|uniref:Uncharacterized protein n=1 Tax=Cercophora samala TaxID=330535 RepID=A0AA39Z7Q6_9PEZI|nr:hypothetical protein QBC41DRAFT_339660 [Cercophora samala]
MAQLPSEVMGQCVAILLYSWFCLAVGLFLLWIVWVHDERKSYVMMLGSFMVLHTFTSIIQQIHTIAWWNDIKTAQWQNVVDNVGNPELNITGASTGLDLVLFYIQYYCYNVESLLIVFWAVELANSIFQLRITKMYRFHASLIAKGIATVIPAVFMVLLRFSNIQASTVGFLILSSGIMIACFLVGSLILLSILGKYVHSRVMVLSWDVRYGRSTNSGEGTNGTNDGTNQYTGSCPKPPLPKRKNIYDRWLVLRFTVAFVALSLFQLVVVMFQLRASQTNSVENVPAEPDLSAGRAVTDFVLYVPGVTAPVLAYLVFGTTRTFRDYAWSVLAPRSWQEKREARRQAKKKPSVVIGTRDLELIRQEQAIKASRDLESGLGHYEVSVTAGRDRANSNAGRERSYSNAGRERSFSNAGRERSFSNAGMNRAYSSAGRTRGNSIKMQPLNSSHNHIVAAMRDKDSDEDEWPIMKHESLHVAAEIDRSSGHSTPFHAEQAKQPGYDERRSGDERPLHAAGPGDQEAGCHAAEGLDGRASYQAEARLCGRGEEDALEKEGSVSLC